MENVEKSRQFFVKRLPKVEKSGGENGGFRHERRSGMHGKGSGLHRSGCVSARFQVGAGQPSGESSAAFSTELAKKLVNCSSAIRILCFYGVFCPGRAEAVEKTAAVSPQMGPEWRKQVRENRHGIVQRRRGKLRSVTGRPAGEGIPSPASLGCGTGRRELWGRAMKKAPLLVKRAFSLYRRGVCGGAGSGVAV